MKTIMLLASAMMLAVIASAQAEDFPFKQPSKLYSFYVTEGIDICMQSPTAFPFKLSVKQKSRMCQCSVQAMAKVTTRAEFDSFKQTKSLPASLVEKRKKIDEECFEDGEGPLVAEAARMTK